jgi:hypothetical protein
VPQGRLLLRLRHLISVGPPSLRGNFTFRYGIYSAKATYVEEDGLQEVYSRHSNLPWEGQHPLEPY